MSNRRRLSAIGTAVLLLATASPASAQAPDEVPEINLDYGVLVALTGAAGVSGQVWDHAASMAVDHIAATVADMGLDTIDVSLVASEDSQGEQAAGIEAAKKLAEVDGANVVIGDFFSAVTIGSFESVFKPSGIIQFTGGTNPGITDLDDDGLLWRPVPSDALQGQVLAAVMANLLGEDAVVNVIARNDAYGVGLADIFVQEWTAVGGTIGEEVIFNPEAATLDTEAQLATQGSPDGWLMVTFCGDWAKLKGPLVRTGAWGSEQDPRVRHVEDLRRRRGHAGRDARHSRQHGIGYHRSQPSKSSSNSTAPKAFRSNPSLMASTRST